MLVRINNGTIAVTLLCFGMTQGVKEMKKMKAGIHPEYKKIKVTCACGNEFESGSVKDAVRVETCSECHPFYTGRQRFADAGGRVDRFNKKYGLK